MTGLAPLKSHQKRRIFRLARRQNEPGSIFSISEPILYNTSNADLLASHANEDRHPAHSQHSHHKTVVELGDGHSLQKSDAPHNGLDSKPVVASLSDAAEEPDSRPHEESTLFLESLRPAKPEENHNAQQTVGQDGYVATWLRPTKELAEKPSTPEKPGAEPVDPVKANNQGEGQEGDQEVRYDFTHRTTRTIITDSSSVSHSSSRLLGALCLLYLRAIFQHG